MQSGMLFTHKHCLWSEWCTHSVALHCIIIMIWRLAPGFCVHKFSVCVCVLCVRCRCWNVMGRFTEPFRAPMYSPHDKQTHTHRVTTMCAFSAAVAAADRLLVASSSKQTTTKWKTQHNNNKHRTKKIYNKKIAKRKCIKTKDEQQALAAAQFAHIDYNRGTATTAAFPSKGGRAWSNTHTHTLGQ